MTRSTLGLDCPGEYFTAPLPEAPRETWWGWGQLWQGTPKRGHTKALLVAAPPAHCLLLNAKAASSQQGVS